MARVAASRGHSVVAYFSSRIRRAVSRMSQKPRTIPGAARFARAVEHQHTSRTDRMKRLRDRAEEIVLTEAACEALRRANCQRSQKLDCQRSQNPIQNGLCSQNGRPCPHAAFVLTA